VADSVEEQRSLLLRAKTGDGDAFAELTGAYRHGLHMHCYRVLGSGADAEDMLQETMMAAWRALDRFEERASLRTWLYTIATNKCLNHLRARRDRDFDPPGVHLPEPTRTREPAWFQPYPYDLLADTVDTAPGPEARYEAREAISLAFIAALQHLPPRQRVALVLRDVLGFPATETAAMLECTVDAANNLLKRARAATHDRVSPDLHDDAPPPGSVRERQITATFADAFEQGNVAAIIGLLTQDAWLTMPPLPFEYQGEQAIGHFLRTITFHDANIKTKMIATCANGQPAFGRYSGDGHTSIFHAHSLIVLTLAGDRIRDITGFMDSSLMTRFGLPRTLTV
jgi:RNA polymerase sigma-70 factor (TIGR02960 family)